MERVRREGGGREKERCGGGRGREGKEQRLNLNTTTETKNGRTRCPSTKSEKAK
jgi:hypothetical protein